jgi:hypothetical protein
MNKHSSFQRFAASTAIASFVVAIASGVAQGIPTNFSMDVMTDTTLMLSLGADGANLLRWGMILDMLGYYLMLLPLALFLQRWLGPKSPDWVRFFTICGLGYIFIGAIGAVTLAAVHPPLILAYPDATMEGRAALETVFEATWNMVFGGLWNILEELLVAVWFFGVGWLLRAERRVFAIVSMILGVAAGLDSLGMILNVETIHLLGLYVYGILAPIWALWLGIDLLRMPAHIQTVQQGWETL